MTQRDPGYAGRNTSTVFLRIFIMVYHASRVTSRFVPKNVLPFEISDFDSTIDGASVARGNFGACV